MKGVKFLLANFGHFALVDITRLKDDRNWLSDSHITLALQCAPFSIILFYFNDNNGMI